ncbi:MAG: hypothetical protein ACI31S_00770 [Bacilli bacterium]
MKELEIYTGSLKYRDIDFTFVFDKKKLKLIPPKEEKETIERWFMKKLETGIYTLGEPLYIEETLVGTCNETGNNIIFIPDTYDVGRINSVLIVNVKYFIINKLRKETIDRIAIKGPEINYIYPTTIALNKLKWGEDGTLGVDTRPFRETTTDKEMFKIDDTEIYMYFGISISSSYKIGEAPLNMNSTLYLEFEPTNNYEFIIKLLELTKKFVQYLCYRRNIIFTSVEISAPADNGLHQHFATLYKSEDNESDVELYPLEKGKFIKYEYIKGAMGNIMNDINSKSIYFEHIPDTYESGRRINAGRFVMITAGFEWEFKRNYPNGIKKSEKTIIAEQNVTNKIENLINNNSGKTKEIFKFLKKLIKTDSLKSSIVQYGKDYSDISDIFGNHLYSLNGEKLNYTKMGNRLSTQRNHFAHGDIDQEFIGLSLLDLIYLEYVIYIMQLKYYGVDDDKIKHVINELFRCNIMI